MAARFFATLLLILSVFVASAFADNLPTPPHRPAEAGKREVPPPPPSPLPPSAPLSPSPAPVTAPAPSLPNVLVTPTAACRERLINLGLRFAAKPDIREGGCGVEAPVIVEELDGGIKLSPPATVSCETAETLARWVKESVQPTLAKSVGAELKSLAVAGSYECRSRNRQPGAPMSEHALGNAIDIASFALAGRPPLPVKPGEGVPAKEANWLSTIRRSACSYFGTVLGPGSDPDHTDHLHLDIKLRSNGFRICE